MCVSYCPNRKILLEKTIDDWPRYEPYEGISVESIFMPIRHEKVKLIINDYTCSCDVLFISQKSTIEKALEGSIEALS